MPFLAKANKASLTIKALRLFATINVPIVALSLAHDKVFIHLPFSDLQFHVQLTHTYTSVYEQATLLHRATANSRSTKRISTSFVMGLLQIVGTQLLIFGGWNILDRVGTKVFLELSYGIPVAMLRLKRPTSGSMAARSHWEMARMILACAYVTYCICQLIQDLGPSAYQSLGVSVTANDTTIKRQFRELAKMYHPDKVGPDQSDVFRVLHEKYSLISDPTSRFLYNRFGPKILAWEMLSTPSEFMHRGLKEHLYQHITMLFQQLIAAVLQFRNWSSRSMSIGTMVR